MRKPIYKPYNQEQGMLPFTYDHLIPANHIVRTVNELIDGMDTSKIDETYSHLGAHSYDPKMMTKIIVYAYIQKIYSSRQIAKAVRENINFIWLAGGNQPDFRTINRFRTEKMQVHIEKVFYEVIKILIDKKYVKYENYFVDGTKIESTANRYTFVWEKSRDYYERRLKKNVRQMLAEIQRETALENRRYGDHDLEEVGEDAEPLTTEEIKEIARHIDEEVKKNPTDKTLKKAQKKMNEDYLPRLEKYEEQKEILDGRNSYSKTDPDATFFHMKDDHMRNGQLKPGYNVQIGTENQFVLHYSLHQAANDQNLLEAHIQGFKDRHGKYPETVVADSGYGNLENYFFLEKQGITGCVKYPWFHREQKKSFKNRIYDFQNWEYVKSEDKFICPQGHDVTVLKDSFERTKTGFLNKLRVYQCGSCEACPNRKNCCKGKGNRTLYVNWDWERKKAKARDLLLSDRGKKLRGLRCAEVENVFGQIKWNYSFNRFHLRGLKKVSLEWGLVCLAHNLRHLNTLCCA